MTPYKSIYNENEDYKGQHTAPEKDDDLAWGIVTSPNHSSTTIGHGEKYRKAKVLLVKRK